MPRSLDALVLAEMVKEECSPIHLLEISVTDSITLRLSDYDSEIVFPTAGNTYSPMNFEFDSVKSTIDSEVNVFKVRIDNTDLTMGAYAENYNLYMRPVKLFCVYEGLLGSTDYERIIRQGFMVVENIDENTFEFQIVSILSLLESNLPNRFYNKYCPWTFDGTECLNGGGSLKATVNGTSDSGTYNTMVDAARTEDDNYWKDGIIEWTSGANQGLKGKVLSSDSSGNFVFQFTFPDQIEEDSYTLIRGCNKTETDCKDKFSNFDNFGGFISVPEEAD